MKRTVSKDPHQLVCVRAMRRRLAPQGDEPPRISRRWLARTRDTDQVLHILLCWRCRWQLVLNVLGDSCWQRPALLRLHPGRQEPPEPLDESSLHRWHGSRRQYKTQDAVDVSEEAWSALPGACVNLQCRRK